MTEHKLPKTDFRYSEAIDPKNTVITEPLRSWLAESLGTTNYEIQPAFNGNFDSKYFRITIGNETHMVIDAQKQAAEYRRFKQISTLFRDEEINAPIVVAEDLARGYLLITDLGSETYREALNEANADLLFHDARAALIKWQLSSKSGVLPICDKAYLQHELSHFNSGFVAQHLGIILAAPQQQALDDVFKTLVDVIAAQANVYVHRDFVPRNLFVSTPDIGILGFQNAMLGAIAYDIASLYKDLDTSWDEERILDGTIRYWEAAKKSGLPVPADFGDFYRDAEWTGLQRHLTMMGTLISSGDNERRTSPQLKHLEQMPRLVRYVRKVGERYVALFPLMRLFDKLNINDGIARTVGVSF